MPSIHSLYQRHFYLMKTMQMQAEQLLQMEPEELSTGATTSTSSAARHTSDDDDELYEQAAHC